MGSFELDESFQSLIDQDEVNFKIVAHLNSVFGKEVKNLQKAVDLVEDLTSVQKELEKRLLFATSEAPDKITRAIKEAELALVQNAKLQEQFQTIKEEITKLQLRMKPLLEKISPNVRIVQDLERAKAYHKWLASIDEISAQIEFHLKSSNEEQSMIFYGKLKESAEAINGSQCSNLKEYTYRMVIHWHDILLRRLEGEIQSELKAMKWPFISSNLSSKLPSPAPELIHRLEVLMHHLLNLNKPCCVKSYYELSKSENESRTKMAPSIVTDFEVSLVPLQLLLKPLEVRFLYHFSGVKATNSRNNPEWYLTQVLKWITSHESFLDNHIQPVLYKNGFHKINVKIEFMRGLVRLVVLKLSTDLSEIQKDEDLFCRTVQETLNFERELRLSLGYPSSQPSVLGVLTQATIFPSWISIERKFAHELMDEFVSSTNAWHSEEETEVSQCGEQLILLLQGINDRYKPLPQPGHRLQFLELQLELLDDFRVRILQMTKSELSDPLQSNYVAILNTVHYIVNTLSDWCDIPFYIEMQYFREKFDVIHYEMKMHPERIKVPEGNDSYDEENTSCANDDLYISAIANHDGTLKQDALMSLNTSYGKKPTNLQSIQVSGSVFEDILNLYSHIESEMLLVVTQHVLTEVRARSQSYRRERWFISPSENFNINTDSIIEISPSLCPLLEVLVRHLHLLREKIAPQLFTKLWKGLATALNKFIYEEVILQNNFSEYGGAQLNYDMTKGLFPIFGEYTFKPENYFILVKESLILLTLSRPTAFLLRDTLKLAKSERDFCNLNVSPVKALEERGVYTLSVQESEIILNIRTNMAVL